MLIVLKGISDAFYCFECTRLEKDRDGCPKIINLGSSRTDLFYQCVHPRALKKIIYLTFILGKRIFGITERMSWRYFLPSEVVSIEAACELGVLVRNNFVKDTQNGNE